MLFKSITFLIILLSGMCATAKPREIWERYQFALIGTDGSDPAMAAITQGAQDAARDLENAYNLAITLSVDAPLNQSPASQVEMIQAQSNIDGLLLIPSGHIALAHIIDSLTDSGTPVVLIGRDIQESKRLATIMLDNQAAGSLAVSEVLKRKTRFDKIVGIVTGPLTDPNQQLRLEAAKAAIADSQELTLQSVVEGDANAYAGRQAIHRLLEEDRNREIDVILCLSGWAFHSYEPLPWDRKQYFCLTIDAFPSMLPHLESGQISALIAQNGYQWGYQAMTTLLLKVHKKVTPETPVFLVEPSVIDKLNRDEYDVQWKRYLK